MASGTGYIRGGFDANDKAYSYLGTRINRDDFAYSNLWKDNESWLTPVYDQHDSGSCVANATAALVRYAAHKSKLKDEALLDPSRLFIYYHARAIELIDPAKEPLDWPALVVDGGSKIRNAMKGLNLVGIAPNRQWPFDMNVENRPNEDNNWVVEEQKVILEINDRPRDVAYESAKKNYTFEYCRLDPDHTDEGEAVLSLQEKNAVGQLTLARLKQCLVEGYPVVFGFNFYYKSVADAFEMKKDPRDASNPDEQFPSMKDIPKGMEHVSPPSEWGAHAVLAIGFKDDVPTDPSKKDEFKGRVLCQNSWGDSVREDKGHFWLPYQYVLDFEATDDFWMLRLFDKDPPRTVTGADFQAMKPPVPALSKEWKQYKMASPLAQPDFGPGSTFAATSRTSGIVDLFWIHEDASVRGAYFNYQVKNQSYWCQLAPDNPLAAPGKAAKGPIAAVSRSKDQVEVWWMAPDGSIQGAHYTQGKTLNYVPYELRPKDSAAPGAGLAAMTDMDDNTAVFWGGKNKSIQCAWRNTKASGEMWYDTFTVAGADATCLNSTLAVLKSRRRMDLWWITKDGAVRGRVHRDGQWGASYEVAPASSAALSSRIAAVEGVYGVIDLFFVSPSGAVKHWYWLPEQDTWEEDEEFTQRFSNFLTPMPKTKWVELPMSIARVDSDIKAVSMSPDRVDVFWVHPNNSICQARAYGGETFRLLAPGQAMPGTPLAAISRKKNNLFVVFKAHAGDVSAVEYGFDTT